jgi:subtilisin family serine protease
MRVAAVACAGVCLARAAGPSPDRLRDPWHHARSRSIDAAASSRFVPAVFDLGPGARLDAFRALTSRIKTDSTRHFEIKNGRLRISYDLMQELAGGALPATGGALGEKLAAFLAAKGVALNPSGTAHADYFPDDEMFLSAPQWSLHNTGTSFGGRPGKAGVDIGIEKVWDKFSGADSLVLAVVDAGFDFDQPQLKGKNWINKAEAQGKPGVDDDGNGFVDDSLGWDFVENDNRPQDRHGHGTFMSLVMAAGFDDHEGVAGVCAKARIMPVRVLDASGHGDQATIAKGILYAVRNGAKAINFSIGGDQDVPALRQAFQTAHDAGVPIIVAAGNDHIDLTANPAYPASYTFDNMLVVAAHDHASELCSFSNYGKGTVHLAAPGEFIMLPDMPPVLIRMYDGFETADLRWDTTGSWGFTTVNPLELKQSFQWKAGNNATLTWKDTLDLTGIEGGFLQFRANFRAANSTDAFIVEGNKIGTSIWTEIAVIGGALDSTVMQAFGLQDFDGSRFRLRFRTSLSSRFSSAGRVLKIDEVLLRNMDPKPREVPSYVPVSGTSVAAPYVTAYVGLMRLACDRMGVPFTRARALAGVDTDAALAGKVITSGRLDAYKGLRFYLETLPDFRVIDSTMNTWKAGKPLEYTLELGPTPSESYVFAETGLPSAARIDGAGKLTWTPGDGDAGEYVARFTAEGPTVLRKAVAFKVEAGTGPVPLASGGAARPAWTLSGQRFVFPPGLYSGRHLVEVFATDAAGKVRLLERDWMEAPALAPAPAVTARAAGFRHWRIRIDGNDLLSSR